MENDERLIINGNAAADEYATRAAQAGAPIEPWRAFHDAAESEARAVCSALAVVLPLWPAARELCGDLPRVSGAAGGAAMGGPATTAVGGGARGAAAASLTGGNVATGAIIGGTAGAIRANNANEPAGTCYNVQTNQRVPCPR
jgi:hypothetical protein